VPILDIGCGTGDLLEQIVGLGYRQVLGVDTSAEAVALCSRRQLPVEQISDLGSFAATHGRRYGFILMCHVLEHLPKREVIASLAAIRTHLLADGGSLLVIVPNAQSATGSYWAYEDFTHETLYTSGSLVYVLRCAGFQSVMLVDPSGTDESRPWVRPLRRMLLGLYGLKVRFWNRVTESFFHEGSPPIFTYELKALAR
jgi:2-polyprenyl-3-methyl-5-hydroxy-6-metoxy-1,4-benzoquinol methylase